MKREARKEKNKEAAKQLRIAAKAEETARAERRAEQERRMQAEAEAAQAKQESDDRARRELSQIYENIRASAAIAQANADEADRQQQLRQADLIAQYHDAVARQELAAVEQRQRDELFLQHQLQEQRRLAEQRNLAEHYNAFPIGEQVSQGAEEMDVGPEGANWEGTEMDTAPEMEAAIETEMDWEQVEEQTPLLAEPLLPLAQSMELPATPALELNVTAPSSRASFVVDSLASKVLEPQASSNPIAEERRKIPAAENVKASNHASTVADEILGPPSAAKLNTATSDQQPVSLAVTRPIEPSTTTPTPAAIVTAPAPVPAEPPAEPPALAQAAAPTAATEEPGIAAPFPPANVLRSPPRAVTPPPPLAPIPAPITSSPKTIKIFLKRAVLNPALAALRPTISSWSPLGRLLSQQKPIPQVAVPQALGKRAMEDLEGTGRDRKKAKLEGEFKFEIGGKRKREEETFPGSKRVCNQRVLAVPCSRLPVTSPTNPPTSTPTNAFPAPASSSPSPLPPPHTVQALPTNHQKGLAEAIKFYNDLPTLRAEIAWMRAQRLNTSAKESRGKKTPNNKRVVARTAMPASYWSRYRENLSR